MFIIKVFLGILWPFFYAYRRLLSVWITATLDELSMIETVVTPKGFKELPRYGTLIRINGKHHWMDITRVQPGYADIENIMSRRSKVCGMQLFEYSVKPKK